jgi:two-component system chemotaxis response regulator CheB
MSKIFVVGASQGGIDVLRCIVSGLPSDFPAALLIVMHIGSEQSYLPPILDHAGPLAAKHAKTGDKIEPGRIYVAPPDHHMLVVDGHLELTRGPRENFARPAIDPLFRSAAEAYGPDAVGVVLSGRLNDGTAGLFEIKRRGGTAIAQLPSTADAPSMPQSAIDNVAVDVCLPPKEIAAHLVRLAKQKNTNAPAGGSTMPVEEPVVSPVAQTCPECGGAMRSEDIGNLVRFRCHIGHAMTAEVLAASQLENLERDLGALFRFLNERTALCRHMAEKHRAAGRTSVARLWQEAAEQSLEREAAAKAMRRSGGIRSLRRNYCPRRDTVCRLDGYVA